MNTVNKFAFAARAALVASIGLAALAASAKPAVTRGYTTGHFALEIDGLIVGWVNGVEGGHLTQDVVGEKLGGDHVQSKTVGSSKYQEISLRCGLGMTSKVYDWIKSEVAGDFTKHSGAIISTDAMFRPIQRLEFQNGLLSVVEFPTLNAESKEPAYLYLKISPQLTKFVELKNGTAMKPPSTRFRPWGLANFRLSIDGTECTKVNRIDALVLKEKFVDSVGVARNTKDGSVGEAASPILDFSIAKSAAETFETMFKANLTKPQKTSGKLEFTDPTAKDVYFTLIFPQLSIYKLELEKGPPEGVSVKRDEIWMNCEKVGFEFANSAVAMMHRATKSTS